MRAASRERMKVVPSITSLRGDMNGRHGCRFCSQFVGFIVALHEDMLAHVGDIRRPRWP